MADTIAGKVLGWAVNPFAGDADSRDNAADDLPLRAELFSADQMEQHGKTLAGIHQLTSEHGPDRLLPRLADNETELLRVCNLLTTAVKANRRITPASEWLLDNFHLIDDQIRTAKRHLPRHYSKALPRLTGGPSADLPRVYDIALEAVAHGDGRLDAESLGRFVEAYQSVSTLKIGELWAIPIMLRLALIENLRRVASRIAANRSNQDQANFWADQMMHTAENDPKSLILVIADMARSNPPLVSSFVSELARRLQGQSAALALPLTWIEQRLSESGSAIDQLVQAEAQNQAAAQVSISNSIGSLRFLAAMDWREFVETLSVVERKLREDPSGVYEKMDFATRDLYRHCVEEMAKHSRLPENDVARKAIQLAHEAAARGADGNDPRAVHVGFYLVDKGLPQLEAAAEVKRPFGQALRTFCYQIPLTLYLGAIGTLSVLFCAALLLRYGVEPIRGWRLALLGALLLVCMSQLAVSLVNWLVSLAAVPRALPRMDFEKGIPAECRTLVVVPSMLGSAQAVDELAETLEVRFLANRDPHLHFALLTDFSDAAAETLPEDAALVELARAHIADLNEKYPGTSGDTFFLFHRPRRWNSEENAWMGYERKRGKLGELNSLLRGGDRHHFLLVVGGIAVLRNVKYVITLDSDTQLPRDTARKLAGAMSHPLNRARYNAAGLRVVAGYGILQPRVTASLPGTNRSRYAALCGSEPGIDPYTRTVSDVYQDLFGEGSFIGKGIYDVDAFERVLDDHFPENRILSHDLLEGCYARSGLLTDVEVYEDYPARYSADASRRHRWIRGDWQIAPWLRRKLPAKLAGRSEAESGKRPNPLSGLSQWKIFDNLRRSVVPPALMLLLLLGWTVLGHPWLWTFAVLGVLLIPAMAAGAIEIFRKPEDVLAAQHLIVIAGTARQRLVHAVFTLACLPYEAWYAVDAIVRTLVRVYITHKHLLQWTPSGDIERKPQGSAAMELFRSYRSMLACPLAAGLAAAYLIVRMGEAWLVAAPVLCVWFAAPAFTWWLSRPLTRRAARLTSGQSRFLNRIARKTWAFFETFVGPAEHWLPPDNFQEHPVAVVAHRTSPTNVGMALLANLAAYDFGYISSGRLLQRTSETFNTLKTLERHQGHFYNWYDTQSLKPLLPLYVSSVDSGNLAGSLLTLRAGLLALPDDRIFSLQVFEGLSDTLRILTDVAAGAPGPALRQLNQMQRELESAYDSRPGTVSATRQWLERLAANAAQVQGHFVDGSNAADNTDLPAMGAPDASPRWWANALVRQCQDALSELNTLVPWSTMPQPPRGLEEFGAVRMPTLRELAAPEAEWLPAIAHAAEQATSDAQRSWLQALRGHVMQAAEAAKLRTLALGELARTAGEFAQMDYSFLYDATRHLLAIGYNVTERRRDAGEYDLLASEARLTTYVGIAQGQFSQESWFAMGRQLTAVVGAPTLLSWSGSMFEYLMPLLIMPTYENSLLDQTCHSAVERQIVYGFQRGVPWGISESGYNAVDASLNYQYRAFGVPGLGLQRGLAEDLVIAPYASALALMIAPEQACLNLQRLASDGMEGPYGFYEAVDYTPARLPRGQTSVIVRSFMAHHQGMSLLALAYLRFDRPMQKRFEADAQFQATTLLLHERIPKATAYYVQAAEIADARGVSSGPEMPIHLVASADTPIPEVQLLSNGKYHVMVTNAGGGYSRWKEFAVTRWREDTTCDNWGSFCYVRDLASGEFWSNSHQPTLKQAASYEALFSEARAEFRRRDGDYDTHTEIVVSPEDDIELRRVRITNRSRNKKTIDVTSYAEVVLATPASDAMQPAFNNLFVQTEIMQQQRAIICTRRPRSEGEASAWMFHLMAVHGADATEISYETDRMRFVGRGRTVDSPRALNEAGALSGNQGSVLDPIVAIRYRITLEAEQTATVDMVTGVGDTRDACLGLVGKYQDRNLAERVFDLAWTHSWVSLRQINATEADAQLYGRLASSVVYANAALRADAAVLVKNRRGQSGLWGYAISGDLPIVLLQIGNLGNIDLVRQLVQAHAYWRLKGLAVDLVIWNEDHAGYRQALQDQIMGLIAAGVEAHLMDRPGGIFVRRAEQISDEDRILLHSVARAIISDRRGELADQIRRRGAPDSRTTYAHLPRLKPTRTRALDAATAKYSPPAPIQTAAGSQFYNGLGGFSPDGREYLISTSQQKTTPLPWVNVLANAEFGSVVTENGAAYTWSENAHEFRLTPWNCDPVSDASGEAFYLRDEESGYFWSPTPSPACGATPYLTRHGFGYSAFEHSEEGLHSELCVYVDAEAPVKYTVLKVRNDSGRPRRVSATGYVEWVLGDLRPKSMMHVITEIDPASGVLFARNAYNSEFADRTAFFDVDESARSASGDRTEFIGRNGNLQSPAAMRRAALSNKVGAGLDPCGALQVALDLAPGQERELVFTLGMTKMQRAEDVGKLVKRFRGSAAAKAALETVRAYWTKTLGTVQVETPDPSLNILANGWLLYQTLACRLWARSGYYQSGGAFGFRDQLQDVMALVHAEPRLTRAHLLRCAAHQFHEGDVQHWWHVPSNRGVRTHCSDDYLWLPLAVCRYVNTTGDIAVLDEATTFLEGRPVNAEDDSYYDLPGQSADTASLYEHCVRAVQHGLRFGERGLPLMGTGDWNDGMNLVGAKGKGESIWLGFFLCTVLTQFGELAGKRGDTVFAERCKRETEQLQRNLEQHGWDGNWYRRAYFDDGTPLGSSSNTECRIDSIAQSWSVLSHAGDASRTHTAMDSLNQHLVKRDHALIQLLDPPFDKAPMNPGYIKGYLPGVRENGGQYTHGAVWAAMAFAELGDAPRAWELFEMINPINHSHNAEKLAVYKAEPYVVAADVYAVAPHTGRGGWTWYSGSAGWLYRLIVESLLGVQREAGVLRLAPCLPPHWKSYKLHYRFGDTLYHIEISQDQNGGQSSVTQVTLDGVAQSELSIALIDDHREHTVAIQTGGPGRVAPATPVLASIPGPQYNSGAEPGAPAESEKT